MNHIAMVFGYVFMAVSAVWLLYVFTMATAELVISGENRLFLMLKVQHGITKYFQNRKRIDALLRSESEGGK